MIWRRVLPNNCLCESNFYAVQQSQMQVKSKNKHKVENSVLLNCRHVLGPVRCYPLFHLLSWPPRQGHAIIG